MLSAFISPLFTIDWPAILEPFDKKKGTVLDFRIGVVCDFEGEWQMLWNKLITLCPYFPVATLFYNHKNTNRNKQLIKRVERVDMPIWPVGGTMMMSSVS